MLTSALNLLGRWGVPARFRKLILFLFAIIVLGLLLGVGKCAYDKDVIKDYTANQRAATAEADRKADNKAANQRVEDQARLTQERQELKEVLNAPPTDPLVDDQLERRRAFHRCLRLQQAARASGSEPPACS